MSKDPFVKGGPYETSDVFFGVKERLIVKIVKVGKATVGKYDVQEGSALLKRDFVLLAMRKVRS